MALLEEAHTLFRGAGQYLGSLDTRNSLAWISLHQGDGERAARLFAAGLRSSRERGAQARVVDCLRGLGAVAGQVGETERGVQLFGAAARLAESVGTPPYPAGPAYEQSLSNVRARCDAAAWEAAWLVGRELSLDEAVAEALAIAAVADRTFDAGGRI